VEVRGEQSLQHARLRRACVKLCKPRIDTIESVVRLSAVVTTTRFLTVLVHGHVAIMSYMDNFSDISDEEFVRASQLQQDYYDFDDFVLTQDVDSIFHVLDGNGSTSCENTEVCSGRLKQISFIDNVIVV